MSTTYKDPNRNRRIVAYVSQTTKDAIEPLKDQLGIITTSGLVEQLIVNAIDRHHAQAPLLAELRATNLMLRVLIAAQINPDDLQHILAKMTDEITTINRTIDYAIQHQN